MAMAIEQDFVALYINFSAWLIYNYLARNTAQLIGKRG